MAFIGASWESLAGDLKPANLARITRTVAFDDLEPVFEQLVAGRAMGRTVVHIGA